MTVPRPGRRLPRSYLYVPGNAADKLPKARTSNADAVIVDLEDAVPLAGKAEARTTTYHWLSSLGPGDQEVWVRVNPGDVGLADVDALAGCAVVDGLVLAKATPEATAGISARLDALGLPWMLSPLIETPEAVMDVRALAGAPRVQCLQIGEYDLCAEVGVTPGADEQETAWARVRIVMAGAAGGLDPAIGPVSTVISDTAAFATSTRRAMAQGFVGRACIHPAQVAVVHEVLAPTREEVTRARAMVALFARAEAAGSAVVADESGRLVDPATVRAARRTLAMVRDPVDEPAR